jgi:hypothetical protein
LILGGQVVPLHYGSTVGLNIARECQLIGQRVIPLNPDKTIAAAEAQPPALAPAEFKAAAVSQESEETSQESEPAMQDPKQKRARKPPQFKAAA